MLTEAQEGSLQEQKAQVVQLTVDWEAWIIVMGPKTTIVPSHLLLPCEPDRRKVTVWGDMDREGTVRMELAAFMEEQHQLGT
jgi:hypothetical protein